MYVRVDLMLHDEEAQNCYGVHNPFKRTVALGVESRTPRDPTPQETLRYDTSGIQMKATEGRFTTISGVPVEPLYGPESLKDFDRSRDLGNPGEFPYTRGIHHNMYRSKLWTMRQFSGFATPEETNRRYRYLLGQGQTGLSVAFDLPTLMGYDADHPMCQGEVGKCGVSISSLEDMEALFRGIPLSDVTVSMTINSPAAVLWAMYLAVAEQQGVSWNQVSGTLQNDILKEYIAQKEYIFPPHPSMRLVTDTIEFSSRYTPRFNPISISGYHIREAGSTAAQELAFTLRDGIEYVDWALERGLEIDGFAGRLSFFFNAHSDFFEEIAKYRAARKIWAHVMRERYGAKSERSWKLRFHAQSAGCSLTWQQPYNNIMRTAWQAMAAVLGGAQSLHTNSLDEAYALPSEHAVTLALRTQQILAHETGVVNTPDPLGGSYFVESLTLQMEAAANEYIGQIDRLGGMIAAIEAGFPQREIASASYRYQREIEQGERIIVGANRFQTEEQSIDLLQIDESAHERQYQKLAELRARRDSAAVQQALDSLSRTAERTDNTMPAILDAVRVYATVGEICEALRKVFGTYNETTHL
jgi:methylmalonyl-CoA mutase, N-terminal domain